ncbi:CCA tRNA nucleotidyltransferase [Peptoniphilus catoniae]|uniref:CCA tRNA nucleotidyltransferase n=1 Tax=Peptoniphilus catoniae TaxID=1660341 RepID=UPI0010FD9322|nr:HD domain-containing protein [Peptoniphilus catoniae]
MPDEILEILKILNENSYKAYIVGGALRDYLLGKLPHDFDLTTDARPEEVEALFKNEILHTVGKKFGTVTILHKGYQVEITSFRLENDYINHRKPKSVVYTKSLEEDLKRRDFTVNAMVMDRFFNIIDPFCGKEDLKNRIIRSVGDPDRRLKEDALRILRAIRFSTAGFTLDEDLRESIFENRELLKSISKERIAMEFNKIMVSDKPSDALSLMEDTGVLGVLFPDLQRTVGYDQMTPYHIRTLFDHIKCVVDHTDPVLSIRLAALFHDISKPDTLSIGEDGRGHFFNHDILGANRAEEILRYYRYPNKLIEKVKILIEDHMKVHEIMSDKALRRQIRRVGPENILDLYNLLISDCYCTTIDRDVSFLKDRRNRIIELLNEDKNISKKNYLRINGKDIINLGFKEGKIIGEILEFANELVLDDPSLNQRETLLKLIKDKWVM